MKSQARNVSYNADVSWDISVHSNEGSKLETSVLMQTYPGTFQFTLMKGQARNVSYNADVFWDISIHSNEGPKLETSVIMQFILFH